MWVGQQQLQQVMALVADSPQWKSTAVWMLAAYVFKLRVPSECLPMVVGIGDSSTYGQAQTSQSIIHIGESEIVLCLKTRKNRCVPVTQAIMSAFMLLCIRPWGARLCRSCWCKECGLTCPVHMLGAALNSWGPGSQPFAGTTASKARANLREVLAAIGVPEASRYRTHDLKRGHTRDMANKGGTLKEILLAADWRCTCQCQLASGLTGATLLARSSAFTEYLDMDEVEAGAIAECHSRAGHASAPESSDSSSSDGDSED